jgi:predicted AAA+ superfamily ATPase
MIDRALRTQITDRLRSFPAVVLLGARQVGKTTLAGTFSSVYYDLEQAEDRLRLDIQWHDLIRSEEMIVLDEAQNDPDLFPRLRSAIDEDRQRNGRFMILGSVSPGLMKTVSEFLTGRVALCELNPFSLQEIPPEQDDRLWLSGGYPDGGILQAGQYPVWQRNYLEMLALRDLPVWGMPARPTMIKRFFRMLAAGHGQAWNASQIGKSLGVSYHTVNGYLDYLEEAYLIRRLQPYHANIRKRLVKSPKVFWRDSGLLHSLLGSPTMDDLLSQPWVGVSWESWVIEQILIFLNTRGLPFDGPYYLRTTDGHELDLVFRLYDVTYAVEIKLSSSPGTDDMKRLQKAAEMIGAEKQVLISRTVNPVENEAMMSTNLRGFLTSIWPTG